MPTFISTATVPQSFVEPLTGKRRAAAVNLAETHLANRDEKVIKARICATGATVFDVKGSQGDTYTVSIKEQGAAFTSCTCKGWTHYHFCRHVDGVRSLLGLDTPLGGGEWKPEGGWLSDTRKGSKRQERVEEF